MLGICLKILSILGIILLILLGAVIGGILLVLFFPVSYRFYGSKDPEGIRLSARLGWLFGLFRVKCEYPVPGCIKVKFLFFTLYNQKLPPDEEGEDGPPKKKARKKKSKKSKGKRKAKPAGRPCKNSEHLKDKSVSQDGVISPIGNISPNGDISSNRDISSNGDVSTNVDVSSDGDASANGEASAAENGKASFAEKISSKIKKIKYTICSIYDKIKEIWKNISYYTAFLQKSETKELLSDSLTALGGILKSIRPRQVKADIRFGTGAPDTTGYIYGIYCILSSSWKPGILVTPDFEEAVLQGEIDVSGRITLWVLLLNGFKIYKLIRKLTAAKNVSA